jgi:hypothetical protein
MDKIIGTRGTRRWTAAGWIGLIFVIMMLNANTGLLKGLPKGDKKSSNILGFIIHTLLFVCLVKLIMSHSLPGLKDVIAPGSCVSDKEGWIAALWIGVLFLICVHPLVFGVTNILGNVTTSKLATYKEGSPTFFGFFLHTLVFVLLLRVLMEFKLPGMSKNIVPVC